MKKVGTDGHALFRMYGMAYPLVPGTWYPGTPAFLVPAIATWYEYQYRYR